MLTTKVHGEDPEELTATGAVLIDRDEMVPLAGMADKDFAALAASILVAIPFRATDGIHPGLATNFGTWARIGVRVAELKDPHGGFIEIVRASTCRTFLDVASVKNETKFLVMIDNDEAIPWDAPLRLARHNLPIVSGVICGYSSERGIFACFSAYDSLGVPRFPSFMDTKTIPDKGLLKVHQVGAGLLCIRRDVIETMLAKGEEPFALPDDVRRESMRAGVVKLGEDMAFSERARRLGFDIHVDFSVRGLHYKMIPIGWPDDAIDGTLDASTWKPSAFEYPGETLK